MKADYWQFLRVGEDGEVWWRLEDAFRLAAGFAPRGEDLENPGALLQPGTDHATADEAVLVAAFHGEKSLAGVGITVMRDGRQHVKADAFLEWASRHRPHARGRFDIPNDLHHSVRFAKLSWLAVRNQRARKEPSVPAFASLGAALADFFDKGFLELPYAVRERVRCVIGPGYWDAIGADERRNKAFHWDYEHDPSTERNRSRAEAVPFEVMAVNREIRELESLIPQTVTEKIMKDDGLKALRERSQRLHAEATGLERARRDYLAGAAGSARTQHARAEVSERRTRSDDMSIELDDILRTMVDAGERLAPAAVMARLKARAGNRESCIVSDAPDGVIWSRTRSGAPEKLRIDALSDRIERWKERALRGR